MSAAARRSSSLTSSFDSGWNWKIRLRLTKRTVDREKRVLGRRPHEDHFALLHAGQKYVLLGLVEAVDLVDEQERPLAGGGEAVVGLGENLANSLTPLATALICWKWLRHSPASNRASVVLPVPGGP